MELFFFLYRGATARERSSSSDLDGKFHLDNFGIRANGAATGCTVPA